MGKVFKVLFAINDLGVGGAQAMVLNQVDSIDRARFDPYLLTIYPQPSQSIEDRVRLPESRRAALKFRGLLDVPRYIELWRYLRREKFDAVVCNLYDANLVVRAVAAACGVPAILAYEHSIYSGKKRWQILADRILARWTSRILVGSTQVRDFTAEQERIPREKFALVYNAAKLEFGDVRQQRQQALASLNLDPSCTYVVTAGRLIEQKGHEHLVGAAAAVVPRNPKVRFLIFGEGELEGKLGRQIESLNLEGKVTLMGVAPMDRVLAAADIFTLPSLWEGLSIALVNAMDARCPVVATHVSGTDDIVVDGVSGLLVEAGQAAPLAAAFLQLLENPELATRLGAAAHERAKLFSIENNVRSIEQIIADYAERERR